MATKEITSEYTNGFVNIQIPLPSTRYIDQFLRLRSCDTGLRELFIKNGNPSKEISESMSSLNNLRNDVNFENHLVIHIGDGMYCRTGILFATVFKCDNICIDPIINTEYIDNWVKEKDLLRFSYYSTGIEEQLSKLVEISQKYDLVHLSFVHSHVNVGYIVQYFLSKIPNLGSVYTLSCCKEKTQLNLPVIYDSSYEIPVQMDLSVLSPKRNYQVFNYFKHIDSNSFVLKQ